MCVCRFLTLCFYCPLQKYRALRKQEDQAEATSVAEANLDGSSPEETKPIDEGQGGSPEETQPIDEGQGGSPINPNFQSWVPTKPCGSSIYHS